MCDNIENCCRICLDNKSDHVSINDFTIQLHMKSCLTMTIAPNDEFPKVICVTCVSQLNDFYNFQLNARCSQDWLESAIQEKSKKSEVKLPIQPLPDSEYNSDSLLEFLNNTANIEEYLNNLGKEDIPAIVNMLEKNNENSLDTNSIKTKQTKQPSPKKKELPIKNKNCNLKMEIDVLDSDREIVKEILLKDPKTPKKQVQCKDKQSTCFACKMKFDNIQRLSQHLSICDYASRTCMHCNLLFDSKQKMKEHSLIHSSFSLTCNCSKTFDSKEKLLQHHKTCQLDYGATIGCIYRCKQCNEIFKERFQLYKHAKEHILKADERICDICGHTFIGNEAFTKHRKDTHNMDDNFIYRCKICYHTSTDHKKMYLHVRKHTEVQQVDRHLCETCGRCFATRASLLRHSLQHVNLAQCKICKKTFADVKTKEEHILEHIEMTMCDRCGQNVNSFKLNEHFCA